MNTSVDDSALLAMLGFVPERYLNYWALILNIDDAEHNREGFLTLRGSRTSLLNEIVKRARSRNLSSQIYRIAARVQLPGGQECTGPISVPVGTDIDAQQLREELTKLRQQLRALRDSQLTTEELDTRLAELQETADQAAGRSAELADTLQPRFLLPRQEDVDVRLVPSHQLDHLEEYRSDENIAFALAGAFGGAVLGILCNWATDPGFNVTRLSWVLMGVFACLTALCIIWIVRTRRRANELKRQMLYRQALPILSIPLGGHRPKVQPEETDQPETE